MNIDKIIKVLEAAKKPGAVVECYWNSGTTGLAWTLETVRDAVLGYIKNGFPIRASLPSPAATRRITKADWYGQPVVWVRNKSKTVEQVVIRIETLSFNTALCEYDFAIDSGWEDYSFDRKTWHLFTVSTPGELVVVASTEDES